MIIFIGFVQRQKYYSILLDFWEPSWALCDVAFCLAKRYCSSSLFLGFQKIHHEPSFCLVFNVCTLCMLYMVHADRERCINLTFQVTWCFFQAHRGLRAHHLWVGVALPEGLSPRGSGGCWRWSGFPPQVLSLTSSCLCHRFGSGCIEDALVL